MQPEYSAAGAIVGPSRPRAPDGREYIGVKSLLEWAFATECATLDYDELGAASGGSMPSYGAEHRIFQQLSLGHRRGEGVRPDTSFGRSLPHDDAELVATTLRNELRFDLAVQVAELARACREPQWDLGQQKLLPREWAKRNGLGRYGKTEICNVVKYKTRGRYVERKDLWVPCTLVPSAAQIAAARRGYLDWYGALLSFFYAIQPLELKKFIVVDRMPPMQPWKKKG